MPRVIISSARTTQNPGKTVDGIREVDVTRKITSSIVPHLRSSGVLTLSTPRELDTPSKIEWINRTGYSAEFDDVAIEIQVNQGNGSKSGAVGWYGGISSEKSKKLGETILTEVEASTKMENQGMFDEKKHPQGSIEFIQKVKPIGLIVGVGFIDNQDDLKAFKDDNKIKEIGKSIAKGLLKYLNVEFKENKTSFTKPPVKAESKPKQENDSPPSFLDSSFGKPASGNNSYMASREERKEMIKKNYIKILGREPNQSDLNYFLNTGITEDQLIKKMIDSQEHVDLVKSRQEVISTKAHFHAQNAEILQLRAETDDKTELINNLNALLSQKNVSLAEMHKKLQYYESNNQNSRNSELPTNIKYQKSFSDKLLGFFSDRLG